MKEKIATITAAAALGLGGWFANNCEYRRTDTQQNSLTASQEIFKNRQSSKIEPGLDPRVPEMVSRVNTAIALLEACSDPIVKEAAATFITLNSNAKIAMAYNNEIGNNVFGVMIVASKKDNFESQIGIAPQTLLDLQLSDQEVGKQMFRTIYIFEVIKNSPERYDQDQEFKDLIDNQADQLVSRVFCAK